MNYTNRLKNKILTDLITVPSELSTRDKIIYVKKIKVRFDSYIDRIEKEKLSNGQERPFIKNTEEYKNWLEL